MSRKPQTKVNSVYSGDNTQFIKAALLQVDQKGVIDDLSPVNTFLINPDSYEDTKTTGWIPNQIPGQSLPVYQWVTGGARTVSFEALVTKDSSYFNKGSNSQDLLGQIANKAISAVGSLASNFFGANIPLGQLTAAFTGTEAGEGEHYSIVDELNYYRSLQYPTYSDSSVQTSPSLLVLYSGKTINPQPVLPGSQLDVKSTSVFILTNLNIKITKQLPNLAPMEALVSFQLEEYPVVAKQFTDFSFG